MKNSSTAKTGKRMARFCIWTIRNHDAIAANIRIYMFAGVAAILFLCIGGVIHLKTALVSIFLGGVSICALLWVLIENRRTQLIRIEDPDLRKEAHATMLMFIEARKHRIEKRNLSRKRFWKKFMPELF